MRNSIKILLGPSTFAAADKTPLRRLLDAGFDVIENPYKRKLTKHELLELLPGVQGIIAGLEPLDKEIMEQSELKIISRCGSGLSNVDLDAAKKLGIKVRNTPLGPTTAVAELTIGCLIILLRSVIKMNGELHRHEWLKLTGRQLKGMKVAVIGFGNIGQAVGRLLLSFGANVVAVDPRFSGSAVNDIPVVELGEALPLADVITIHSSGERCLLGGREFGLMKKGVFLLNAARGGLVDENALRQALDEGLVTGAWLDTFQNEPYSGILCGHEKVILTPHIGSYTIECRCDMEMEAVQNLIEAFN